MESHNSRLYMSLTKVLVFLDSARQEGCDFLEDLVKSLQTNEELKKLVTTLSGRSQLSRTMSGNWLCLRS